MAHIQFSAWDPDQYFTLLDQKIGKYVYNRWMVLAAILLFLFEGVVFMAKWNIIGPDISTYFDFSKKTFSDLVEFWVLLFGIGFVHESSHGLTCKHYGGEVHSMGLMFLYLTPCFFVDVTESWVSAGRMQRMATIIAGIWMEMMLCGVAVMVWTNTQPGEWVHDFCYKLILLTGIAVPLINLNPLIKLDGYYFFTEWLRVPDLKERSTSFLIGWIQRHILRLAVDVPVVSRRRVPLFVVYALASGVYSYMLLWLFVRFSYNVFFHWFAELALVPAALLAFVIFRSRLRELRDFLLSSYRTKAEEGAFRLTPLRAVLASALLAILFVPIMRDRENAYFVIEPREVHQVHAGVPGRVSAVYVKEGDVVRPGQVMARLQSLIEASASEDAAAQVASSQAQVFTAELKHSALGPALAAQQAAGRGARHRRRGGGKACGRGSFRRCGRDQGSGEPAEQRRRHGRDVADDRRPVATGGQVVPPGFGDGSHSRWGQRLLAASLTIQRGPRAVGDDGRLSDAFAPRIAGRPGVQGHSSTHLLHHANAVGRSGRQHPPWDERSSKSLRQAP